MLPGAKNVVRMLSLIKGANEAAESTRRGPPDHLASLAAAVASGNPAVIRTFINAVGGTVLVAVRMVLGPRHHDVDDVAQDAIVGLLEALPRFRGDCTVAHFASRVAVLTAMASRRRQQTRERWVVSEEPGGDFAPTSPESSPLAQLERARRREAIRRLLDELPESLGEAMALHFMLGHTAQEIAAATQVSVNTVWSRLRLGRERLRQILAADTTLSEELSKVVGEPRP
jgi:RNA polymerase sigma factor (sigma-70 family)